MMSDYQLRSVDGSSDATIDKLMVEDVDEELASSDFELDLTDSSQPVELPDIYPSDESFDAKAEVDRALRHIELGHSYDTKGLAIPDYESPVENNNTTLVISDDSEPDQEMEHSTKIEACYVETDSYKYKPSKVRLGRMKPYDTKLTEKKGKQLMSGKRSAKSSTHTIDQLDSGTSTFQQHAFSDSGFADDGASLLLSTVLMYCDSCKSKQSHNSVVQCCDGHILCAQCVEKSTKLVLIGEKKGSVDCPLPPCESSIPDSELRKSLPAIVLDLLEEKWKKDTLEALENMKDAVRCPGCDFSAVLDVGIRKFPCSNCGKAFCRVCDKRWEEKSNHDLCYRTKQWTSSDNGAVLQIPAHWSNSNSLEVEPVVELSSESEEFFDISSLIFKDLPVNVSKVYRIQNVRLWEKYSLTKRHMMDDLGDVGINEQRLFHGTTGDVVEAICKEGFDWRLCGKHGTAFGKGSYFAKNARMSDMYSSGKTGKSSKNGYFLASRPAFPNTGGFHFGASNSNLNPGGFHFGASSTNSNSGGLRFGAPSTNSNSGGLRFGAPSTDVNSGGLRFGAPSTDVNSGGLQFGAHSSNSNSGGLQFGAHSSNSNSGGLQFGAHSSNSNSGGFPWGAFSNNSSSVGIAFVGSKSYSNSGVFVAGAPRLPIGLASSSSNCLMFIARVLLGRSCLGNSNMRRPETNANGESTHSAVNKPQDPTIYVIFDSSQCYPEYLIQYSSSS